MAVVVTCYCAERASAHMARVLKRFSVIGMVHLAGIRQTGIAHARGKAYGIA